MKSVRSFYNNYEILLMYQMNVMFLHNPYHYLKNNNKTSFEITYLLQIETVLS